MAYTLLYLSGVADTRAEAEALTPTSGTIFYCKDTNEYIRYNGSVWGDLVFSNIEKVPVNNIDTNSDKNFISDIERAEWDAKQDASIGVFDDLQISVLQSDGTLNAASGVQTWAGTNKTGQDVFTVSANTTYIVEGRWYVNTGSTTHTTAIAWALSTATVTDFQYQVILWSAAANTTTTAQSTTHVSGVASKVLNATSTSVYTIIQFKGILVVGTGGTITPQINFSANPTGTNLMKRGSFTSFSKLFTNTDTTRGTWA